MAVFQEKNKSKWTKDGRKWFYKCYYKDLLGNNKIKKSKLFLTKKEAEEAERLFINESRLSSVGSDITFKELIEQYKIYLQEKKITTYQSYNKRIKHLETLNNIKLKDFNINHFNKWKSLINEKDYKVGYKNTLYKTIRSTLNYAIKYMDMYFLESVMKKMSNFTDPNELKEEMLFYTYEEFKSFIEQEKDLKYKLYFEMLYYCGLRKGEANAINWHDINFDNNTVNISKNVSLKIKGKKYVILPPKTKNSNRVLPISNSLTTGLKKLKKQYEEYSNFNESWFVFGGIFPLSDSTVNFHRDNCCKLANVKRIRIHDFRHSCASLLINNGASITLVAKYLGHSNIATTLNTYTHMFKNQFDDIIKLIDNLDKKGEK